MDGIALILAGGGGKGSYQIGVWKALKEYGIDKYISAVSGTSVGALNAALFLQGDYELAEKVYYNISNEKILKIDIAKHLSKYLLENNLNSKFYAALLKSFKLEGAFSREGLIEIIEEFIDIKKIADSKIKGYATCCKIPFFEPVYFQLNAQANQKIVSILLASSALPLIYDSEIIDGENYYDGGIVDNTPVKPLYDQGYRDFIVIHLDRAGMIECEKYSDARFIQIIPKSYQGKIFDGTLDFSKEGVSRRINAGFEDTAEALSRYFNMDINLKKCEKIISDIISTEKCFNRKIEEELKRGKNIDSKLESLLRRGGHENEFKSRAK